MLVNQNFNQLFLALQVLSRNITTPGCLSRIQHLVNEAATNYFKSLIDKNLEQEVPTKIDEIIKGIKEKSQNTLKKFCEEILDINKEKNFQIISENFDSICQKIKKLEHSPDTHEKLDQLRDYLTHLFDGLRECQTLSSDLATLVLNESEKIPHITERIARLCDIYFSSQRQKLASQSEQAEYNDKDFPDSLLGTGGRAQEVDHLNRIRQLLTTHPQLVFNFISFIEEINAGTYGKTLQKQIKNYPSEAFQEHRLPILIHCYALLKSKTPHPDFPHIDTSLLSKLHEPMLQSEEEKNFCLFLSNSLQPSLHPFTRENYSALGWIFEQMQKKNPLPFTQAILSCPRQDANAFKENLFNINRHCRNKMVHALAFGAASFGTSIMPFIRNYFSEYAQQVNLLVANTVYTYAPRLAYHFLLEVADRSQHILFSEIFKNAAKIDPELCVDAINFQSVPLPLPYEFLDNLTQKKGPAATYQILKKIRDPFCFIFYCSQLISKLPQADPLALKIIEEITPGALAISNISLYHFIALTLHHMAPEAEKMLEKFNGEGYQLLSQLIILKSPSELLEILKSLEQEKNLESLITGLLRALIPHDKLKSQLKSLITPNLLSALLIHFFLNCPSAPCKNKLFNLIPFSTVQEVLSNFIEERFANPQFVTAFNELTKKWNFSQLFSFVGPLGNLLKDVYIPLLKEKYPQYSEWTEEHLFHHTLLSLLPPKFDHFAIQLLATVKEISIQKELCKVILDDRSQTSKDLFLSLLNSSNPKLACEMGAPFDTCLLSLLLKNEWDYLFQLSLDRPEKKELILTSTCIRALHLSAQEHSALLQQVKEVPAHLSTCLSNWSQNGQIDLRNAKKALDFLTSSPLKTDLQMIYDRKVQEINPSLA